jgi:hypothetical protein
MRAVLDKTPPASTTTSTEFDHWYARNRARAEETWLVCGGCNSRLNDTEFKGAHRSEFESYQFALRRVIQSRQATLVDRGGERGIVNSNQPAIINALSRVVPYLCVG